MHFLFFFCILGIFLGGFGIRGRGESPQEIAGNNTVMYILITPSYKYKFLKNSLTSFHNFKQFKAHACQSINQSMSLFSPTINYLHRNITWLEEKRNKSESQKRLVRQLIPAQFLCLQCWHDRINSTFPINNIIHNITTSVFYIYS